MNLKLTLNSKRMDNPDRDFYTAVLDKYFAQRHILVAHQIDSFNTFIREDIRRINHQNFPFTFLVERPTETVDVDALKGVKYYRVQINFHDVEFLKPRMEETSGQVFEEFPNSARIKNLTYEALMSFKLSYSINFLDKNLNILQNFTFDEEMEKAGFIPIMLRSCLCNLNGLSLDGIQKVGEDPYDFGGYFVVKGSEKFIVPQEKRTDNYAFLFRNKGDADFAYVVEIKSVRDDNKTYKLANVKIKFNRRTSQVGISVNPGFGVKDTPLVIMFRALGVITDKEIAEYVVSNLENKELLDLLRPSLRFETKDNKTGKVNRYKTRREAMLFIAEKAIGPHQRFEKEEQKLMYVETLIDKFFFPHIIEKEVPANSNNDDPYALPVKIRKARYLGLMVRYLFLGYLGKIRTDDRDDLANKRIDLSGNLMAQLYRYALYLWLDTLKKNITKELTAKNYREKRDFEGLIKRNKNTRIMENPFKGGLLTGSWKTSNTNRFDIRAGVSQVLQRKSRDEALSNLRRVYTPTTGGASSMKTPELRRLHPSSYGMICPVETPDGEQTGVVKHLAMTAKLTTTTNKAPIVEALRSLPVIPMEEIPLTETWKYTTIMINGDWYGSTSEPSKVVNTLRQMRRKLQIDIYTSIVWVFQRNEIHINCDAGRFTRPLYIVDTDTNTLRMNYDILSKLKNPKEGWKWSSLIREQVIEYIDVEEAENNVMTTLYPSELKKKNPILEPISHCEIHPSTMLGILISLIPFSEHNQAPRNLFQGAMGKQAINVYATNFALRFDKGANIIHYPQRPLVSTYTSHTTGYNHLPAGNNTIIAIMMYSGYNQEDSILANLSSFQRGLFNTTHYTSSKEEAKNEEKFTKPDPERTLEMKSHANYSKLNSFGVVPEGTEIDINDVIIGKVTSLGRGERTGRVDQRDISVIAKEHGIVDKVITEINNEGYEVVKVRLRNRRIPQIGDKASSRHGQKGIIGMRFCREDMPFTESGITPDLIINPQAIPSRMTIGQLIELVGAKAGAMNGEFTDGTPFTNVAVEDLLNNLKATGFNSNGTETLYNGFTGQKMEAQIFIGPCFYQRLKHVVEEKMHARATGQVQMLTRQPLEGRARDGGLRFGEMERDAMIGYGASQFLKERFYESSDKYKMYLCNTCGNIAVGNPEIRLFKCIPCAREGRTANIVEVKVPYSSKLLVQEVKSMALGVNMFAE